MGAIDSVKRDNEAQNINLRPAAKPDPAPVMGPPAPAVPPERPGDAQSRLAAFGGRPAVPAPQDPITPERRDAITRFADDNVDATTKFLGVQIDSDAGEIIGSAINGNSSLGTLNPAEQRLLADRAVLGFQRSQNSEAVSEMIDGVRTNPVAARAVAGALATPAADAERHFATGGTYAEAPGSSTFRHDMLKSAIQLDPAETLRSFTGAEGEFGRIVARLPAEMQRGVLDAAANGAVPAPNADRLATSMFVYGNADEMRNPDLRRSMSNALAAGLRPGTTPQDSAAREILANRLNAVLDTDGGRQVLFGREVLPDTRAWALGELAANPEWTADALRDGWESTAVSQSFAQRVNAPYTARGTEPQVLGGEALRNIVGQGLRIAPDQVPPQGETPEAAATRMQAGLDHRYYGANTQIDAVSNRIRELGGDQARVTVIPVTVTNNDYGAATYAVFRVEGTNGQSQFVDHNGLKYSSLEDWTNGNRLPEGKMTFPAGMQLGNQTLETRNTPGVIDTIGERAGQIADGVAMAAGIVAGVAVIVGTGGTAAPLVAAGAGAYMTARAGAGLYDDHQRGIDISDLSNESVRSRWLDVAAGTLSLGAIGASVKAANLARVSVGTARTVAGLQLAANTADAVAMTNQSVSLAQNWDRMSNADRAAGLLNIAFWGGMTAASTRANGGQMRDSFSFTRLENNVRFGSPYPVAANTNMAPGEMRVAYETVNGRNTNVRIEHGAGTPNTANLALHTATARQVEMAGGLQDRLTGMLTGRNVPEPGSVASEVQLELNKIAREARALATEQARPGITPDRQADIATRQRELEQDMRRQEARLNDGAAMGDGFIAAPRSLTDITNIYAANGDILRGSPLLREPDLAVPAADAAGQITYGALNADKQATGIEATITADMLNTGSSAKASIEPPGWGGGAANHSRGHLLARMLGGSGTDETNLVTLFQRNANSPVMRDFEEAVYRAVQAGETVNYRATPIYADDGMPTHVVLTARGSDGFDMQVTIVNRDGRP